MLASLTSAALVGLAAEPVQVEVNTAEEGEPRLMLVGLPDAAVRESCDRVFSALSNGGYGTIRTRTTINLAPGSLRKAGPMYDLPIALGIVAASGRFPVERLADFLIAGELGLSGMTRPVRGALAIAQLARKLKKRALLLPGISAEEAALVDGIKVYRVDSLTDAVEFFSRGTPLPSAEAVALFSEPSSAEESSNDFADVKGQLALRRAIEVAVAGAHHLLILGPPGSGKSMTAKRIPSIMPPPTREERLDILAIQSVAGRTLQDAGRRACSRPFRSPHHTISEAALLGGGAIPGPGEVSLAHHGVLFLDELPEFRRSVLQVLRQPVEDGEVNLSRHAAKLTFPCAFMLVAAMNPCPCGHLGDSQRACRCSPTQIEHYRSRVGGPLLDRIDLHVEAPALSFSDLARTQPGESSACMRTRVLAARARQRARLGPDLSSVNARMRHAELKRHCALEPAQTELLQTAMQRLGLSARAYDRILKVARTIADLAGSTQIDTPHLLEAIQYRTLDRQAT